MVAALEDVRGEKDRQVLAGHMALWGFQDYSTAQVLASPHVKALQYGNPCIT